MSLSGPKDFFSKFGKHTLIISAFSCLFLLILLGILFWMHLKRRRQTAIDDRRNSLDLLEKGKLEMRPRRPSVENRERGDSTTNGSPLKDQVLPVVESDSSDEEKKVTTATESKTFSDHDSPERELPSTPLPQEPPTVPSPNMTAKSPVTVTSTDEFYEMEDGNEVEPFDMEKVLPRTDDQPQSETGFKSKSGWGTK